jgi:hypothetical protein
MTEYEYANHIRLLGTNKVYKSYIGLGTTQQLFLRQFKEIFLKTQDGTPLTHHTKQKLHKEDWKQFKFPLQLLS